MSSPCFVDRRLSWRAEELISLNRSQHRLDRYMYTQSAYAIFHSIKSLYPLEQSTLPPPEMNHISRNLVNVKSPLAIQTPISCLEMLPVIIQERLERFGLRKEGIMKLP